MAVNAANSLNRKWYINKNEQQTRKRTRKKSTDDYVFKYLILKNIFFFSYFKYKYKEQTKIIICINSLCVFFFSFFFFFFHRSSFNFITTYYLYLSCMLCIFFVLFFDNSLGLSLLLLALSFPLAVHRSFEIFSRIFWYFLCSSIFWINKCELEKELGARTSRSTLIKWEKNTKRFCGVSAAV